MLRPRITPCLLLKGGGLVKTVQFGSPKYVGDPINAVRIFNEKEVDELIVVDIDATAQNREPNYGVIKNLAAECRMPLCYGGGVKSVEQFQQLVALGVEKVSIGSAAVENPKLIREASIRVGSQSVVVVLDVTRKSGTYLVATHNGARITAHTPVELAKQVEDLGAGEIVINDIDRDGTMTGYDLELVSAVRDSTTLPITAIGGAGSLDDIGGLIRRFGIIGAAAGSLFVFKGSFRAVLITYLSRAEKDQMLAKVGFPHAEVRERR
ncbi:MAG: AglZ/HisF2 family acetamidino modification protein [Cyanobacteria bacterium]|nr:AglZ/HisF2 family acetamidino modification protein [Cyanobacteriota bacterium]